MRGVVDRIKFMAAKLFFIYEVMLLIDVERYIISQIGEVLTPLYDLNSYACIDSVQIIMRFTPAV